MVTRSVLILTFHALAAIAQPPRLIPGGSIGTDWQPGAHGWMNFVAISSDGRAVAANGNIPGVPGGALGFWTFPAGEFLRSVAGGPSAISPDFRRLATGTDVQNLETGQNNFQVPSKTGIWTHAAFSRTGEYVALVGGGNIGKGNHAQITVSETASGAVVSSFGTRYAAAVAFRPDNQTLASGHWNNITLWNVRTGARLGLLMSPTRPVDPGGYNRDGRYICGLEFSADGNLLAAGSDDGELQIWDVTTRKLLHSLKIGWGDVSNPAFSPDGKLLAAGTYANGTLSLVDVSSGAILSQIQVSMFGCGSVAFSPDGNYLIAPANGGLLNDGRYEKGGTIRVFRVAR